MQDPLLCAPVLTNKPPGRKLITSAKYLNGTILGNEGGVPHKVLGIILPACFHRWATTRLLHSLYDTKIRTPVWM